HQMGREMEKEGALFQGLQDQGDVEALQIANAAVSQARRVATGSSGQIAALEQRHSQAAKSRVPRDSGTLDSTPDDDQVVTFQIPRSPSQVAEEPTPWIEGGEFKVWRRCWWARRGAGFRPAQAGPRSESWPGRRGFRPALRR